ncbi:MAG: UDP-N-acetylmuramate--L-alanine ligase, partial [Chloroflexi bacterium]|nr:UDP-N-acetylmuramate--L-alanine ligase [Chloroflexota bacterium]
MTRHTHFIGIGGAGLSAIARVLLERGEIVSGSDYEESMVTKSLERSGVQMHIGHSKDNIAGADLVVRSSAVGDENVEALAAREAGIKVVRREEYLRELLEGQEVIAVAGSHGKTTTTAMIAWMLTALHQKPGFIAGGEIENLGANAGAGKGELFVIEADEYDYMFLGLDPSIAIVTNVEHDHPDFFPTPEDFEQAFRDFVARIKPGGTLVVCLDDPGSASLLTENSLEGKDSLSYGLSQDANFQARNLKLDESGGFRFDIYRENTILTAVTLQIPGRHNVRNALAAVIVADILGLPLVDAAQALSEFRGAARRFDVLGEREGVTVIDDYAHHPTEIRATLDAARERYPDRHIWALWQPHTYSRTSKLLNDYSVSFRDADSMLMAPVYAPRE